MRAFVVAIAGILSFDLALAEEPPTQLKQAPGLDKVEMHCNACHSLDYIVMNSPFLDAAGWSAEVAKMINAFGAPIDQADAEVIAKYLTENYSADRQGSGPPAAEERRSSGAPSRIEKRESAGRTQRAARKVVSSPASRRRETSKRPVHAKRVATYVPRLQPKRGLVHWPESHLARPRPELAAGARGSPYECFQDEGYGRRTPCGAGASGGGGGGGGGDSGGGSM